MSRWISVVVLAAALAPASLAQSTQPAVIVVRVPPNAEVVIGSQKMTQTGPERRFVTTPLEKGTYIYEVTVSWTEGNKKFKKTRPVQFSPGKTAVIEFNSPPSLAAAGRSAGRLTSFVDEPKPGTTTFKILAEDAADPLTATPPIDAKSRTFVLTYAGKVTGMPPGKSARIWLPKPANSAEQNVALELPIPGSAIFATYEDKIYGNPIFSAELKANDVGEIPFSVAYRVTRREVKTYGKVDLARIPLESGDLIVRYLQPDSRVPIDGRPLDLVKDKKISHEPVVAARALYDVVNAHMKYGKEGTGWGQGDAVWACDSKFGNCTDFHSLFISLARAHKIVAKFEMGFSIPPKRGEGPIAGYHCWAWFMPPGKGWVPVDISEANRHPEMKDYYFGNLTDDRIHFSTGRDIVLEPRQSGPPLNFFIHPYVEVDGQPYAAEKVQRSISYKDVE